MRGFFVFSRFIGLFYRHKKNIKIYKQLFYKDKYIIVKTLLSKSYLTKTKKIKKVLKKHVKWLC